MAVTTVQPVPSFALPFIGNEAELKKLGIKFNPLWLKWFLDMIKTLQTGGGVDHNTLTNLQGGTTNQFYHLTSARFTTLTGVQAANIIFAGPTTGAAAIAAFRALVTADLADQIVTYAKIQNVTDARLLGRSSGSAGPPIEISVSTGLSLAAGVLTCTITQYTDELAQDAVGSILTDTTEIDFTYNDGANTITADIKTNSVIVGRMHFTGTDMLCGRATAGAGGGEEISCTAQGRAILASAAAPIADGTYTFTAAVVGDVKSITFTKGIATGVAVL